MHAEAVANIFERFEADRSPFRHVGSYGAFSVDFSLAGHIAIHFARDGRATIFAGDKQREPGTPGARRIIRLDYWPTAAEAVELLAEHFAELAADHVAKRAARREFLAEFWGRNTPSNAERLLADFDAETERLDYLQAARAILTS